MRRRYFQKWIKGLLVVAACFSFGVFAADQGGFGVAHPPVKITFKGESAFLLLLTDGKNLNLLLLDEFGEKASLRHVKAVSGVDAVESVFFYRWKNSGDTSVHVLTRRPSQAPSLVGNYYSTLSLDVVEGEKGFELFAAESGSRELVNCFEGKDTVNNEIRVCQYKNAAAVKKYMSQEFDR